MKRKFAVLLILIGTIGCNNSGPKSDTINDTFASEQDKIKSMLADIFNTAKAKNMDSLDAFHLRGAKFSRFDGENPGRQDYEMGKKSEYDFFTGVTEFNFTLPDVKVDVFDDTAIASFIIAYDVIMSDTTISGKEKGTLVFVKDKTKWKIAHEHFSSITTP